MLRTRLLAVMAVLFSSAVAATPVKVVLQKPGGTWVLDTMTPSVAAPADVSVVCQPQDAPCAALLPGLQWQVNGVNKGSVTTTLNLAADGVFALVLVDANGATYGKLDLTLSKTSGSDPSRSSNTSPPSSPCLGTADPAVRPYNAEANRAEIFVSTGGNVLAGDLSQVDENDAIDVRVLVPSDRVGDLVVRRSSALRDRTIYRVVGEGSTFRTESAPAPSPCVELTVILSDFAPGKAGIEIGFRSSKGQVEVTGAIEFVVNPLYFGTFSFGGAWTWLGEEDYTLSANADGTSTVKPGGQPRLVYALLFTPYVWGRRDLEKEGSIFKDLAAGTLTAMTFFRKFNPTVGLSLNTPLDNAFVGVSTDIFEGIMVSAGAHVGRVKIIEPRFDPDVRDGDTYQLAPADVPTSKGWRVSGFFGVTLDLRAAVKFLQTVFGLVLPRG